QSTDIRFTTKGNDLYAFCLGRPTADIRIESLGKNSKIAAQKVASVTILGSTEKIHWKQEGSALVIKKDFKIPATDVSVLAFKIEFK
ncbi:MAG TPA: alpha-L-fucosidase C-terminal domain-containing protein, partial [Ginsengibacter sp.]|nr:alpha-L-fucosidase C-terminal domain-containing protein [Ginsengibacter sp.]